MCQQQVFCDELNMYAALYFLLVNLVVAVTTLLAVLLVYIKWRQQYWTRRNTPHLEAQFPWGNVNMLSRRDGSLPMTVATLYNQIKADGYKHCGIYMLANPVCMAVDLDLVKNVMTKDFQNFTDRGILINEKHDPLSAHLFSLGGVKWRNLRTKLTPTFTSGKMKMMFQTLLECEKPLIQAMEHCYQQDESVDIKEMFARYTIDIIGSCAFGLECDSFRDGDAPFRRHSRKLFQFDRLRAIKMALASNFPFLVEPLHLRMLPKEASAFYLKVVKDMVGYRETNHVRRNDFLQLLTDLKSEEEERHDGTSLTMNDLAAQCFVFFFAGFETSSTTSAFALYELARNQNIQDKVRDEIYAVLAKHGGKVTYEGILEMKYMGQVIDETLRLYPSLGFLTRKCVKDYPIPDSDVVIEKGIRVMIPVLGIHKDPEYYPDPEKFDPERFTEDNKQKRHPYAHLPFGEGPRICIGMRFGLMQTKMGLTALLKNYKFTVSEKTKEPLEFLGTSFVPSVKGGLWLNVERIK